MIFEQHSTTNESVSYAPPIWLPGGNLQTIYPYALKPAKRFDYRRERWELDDGDFVDTDWVDGADDRPLVVFFHGLEGNSSSHYIVSTINHLKKYHWSSVVVHFRSCSGIPNRLPRAYHAGDSADIDQMLQRVAHQIETDVARRSIYVVGVSLGGNALLKWLGERNQRAHQLVSRVVAISVPLDLAAAGTALDSGFNQVYTQHFLATLKSKAFYKLEQFPGLFDGVALKKCSSIYQFDNLVTAPLHGFRDTDHYWRESASKQWLKDITVPTLIINARNDPFMPASALPKQQEVSSSVTLEFPEQGGHAGFLQGAFPGKFDWLPTRIMHFFQQNMTNQGMSNQK